MKVRSSVKKMCDKCRVIRRHGMSLPGRGQRTRTNARTRRGARTTVAGKKK